MVIAGNLTQDIRVPTISIDLNAEDPAGGPVAGTAVTASGIHGDGSLSLVPGDRSGRGTFESSVTTGRTAADGW